MGRCLKIILLNICTLDTHTAVDPGSTIWAPDVILNACSLDTHTAVDPGYNFWTPDVF